MRVLRVDREQPDPDAIALAAEALRLGGLVIYPTDTLYALGAAALNPSAVAALRKAKKREKGKALPLVAADVLQARSLWAEFPAEAEALARHFWPGPLSLVLHASPTLSREVSAAEGTVAVRVPASPLARALAGAGGPLVATSANLSGEEPPMTCAQAVAAFEGTVFLALDSGPAGSAPSTIVDLSTGEPRLLREGAISWGDVLAVLRRDPR